MQVREKPGELTWLSQPHNVIVVGLRVLATPGPQFAAFFFSVEFLAVAARKARLCDVFIEIAQ